jgi:hypothetical protein
VLAGRQVEIDGAEGGGEGVGVPRCRSGRRRLVEGTEAVGGRRGAGQQRLLWRRAGGRWGTTWAASGWSGPHVNGPGPWVEDRGPLGATGTTARRATVATATATVSAAVDRLLPEEFPPAACGGREEEEPTEDVGAEGWVGAVVTSAEAGDDGVSMLSSARRRSARISAKEGKGRCRVMNWVMN